jgi:hypothetical protein
MTGRTQTIRVIFILIFVLIICESPLFSARISPLLESVYNAHKSAVTDTVPH